MDEEDNVFSQMLNVDAGVQNAPATAIEAPAEEDNVFTKMLETEVAPVESESTNPFESMLVEDRKAQIPLTKQEADVPTTPLDPDATLQKSDLLRPEYLGDIRKFMGMYYGKGTEYEDMDAEQVVDEFVTNMRWFNTNFVSTARMGVGVLNSTDEEKATLGRALEAYDKLGNVFVNDGLYGAASGVKDYVFAMAADPTNYVGLLTLGISKAGTAAATKGGVEAVKLAAREAAKGTLKKGAVEGAEAAAKAAAQSMAAKLAVQGTRGAVAQAAADKMYQETLEYSLKKAGMEAAKESAEAIAKGQLTKDILKTTAADAALAMTQNLMAQGVYIEAGQQEDFSAMQLAISGVAGTVGGGVHLMFSKFDNVSKLGSAEVSLALAQDSRRMAKLQDDYLKVTKPSVYEATDKIVKDSIMLWEDKVAAGRVTMGEAHRMPQDILKNILFGDDMKGGLRKLFEDEGITVDRDMRVTDFLTNYMEMLPKEQRSEVSERLSKLTGLKLGDFVYNPQTLGNIISETASESGSYLNLLSQFSRTVDSGIVAATDKLAKEAQKVSPSYLGYIQNTWRKLLVSTPQTAMANVFGAAQFYGGQTIADMFSSASYGVMALVSTGAKRGEYWRMSKALMQLQHQKLLNLMDPFTTHDAYMAFLGQHKEVDKVLHESLINGVMNTADRFNISPDSKLFQLSEGISNAALTLSGTRVQDSFMKSQFFVSEIDKVLRLKHNTTFVDVINSGKWDLIDEDVQQRSINATLEGIMSFDYTKPSVNGGEIDRVLSRVAGAVEGISNTPIVGTLLPFGRFMNNIVAYSYKWSPFGLIEVTKALKYSDSPVTDATDALSRTLVGSGLLAAGMVFAESQMQNGRAPFELDVGGNLVNIQNQFPASLFIAFGDLTNKLRKGQDATTAAEEFAKQLAIGQAAGNLEFGNDLNAIYRYIGTPGNEETGKKLLEHLYTQMGNVGAGFFRPLDPINKLVGVITDTDVSRDLRVARGTDIITERGTRYIDNIFEGTMKLLDGKGEVPKVSSKPSVSITRGDEIRDPNPISTALGLRQTQPKTNVERVFDMAGIAAWKETFYSGVPEFDRLANERIQPVLEKMLSPLLKDKRFMEGDQNSKRDIVKERLKEARKVVKAQMRTESPQTALEAIRLRINDMSDAKVAAAIRSLRERGVTISTSDPRDMTAKECQAIIEWLKLYESGYEYKKQ